MFHTLNVKPYGNGNTYTAMASMAQLKTCWIANEKWASFLLDTKKKYEDTLIQYKIQLKLPTNCYVVACKHHNKCINHTYDWSW